jgi:biotin-(acetyl-CoA carboxylase) ligase
MKEKEVFERYKKLLFMLGTNIIIVKENQNFCAKALDIDNNGYLIVQLANGEVKTLSSGEIKVLI